MAHWDRYEIWTLDGSDWALHSCWRDIDFASPVFRARSGPVRLVHASCDDEKVIERRTLGELESNTTVSSRSWNTTMSPSPEAAALEAVADGIGIKFVVTHGPESRILLYGCGLYLASNVIGQGLGVLADPRAGLMAAAAGLLICGLSIARCKGSEHTRRIVRQLRAALLVGFSSFVVALVVAAARPFYDLNNSTWGAVPPPWLTFSALYGTISLITTFGVSRWFHRATAF